MFDIHLCCKQNKLLAISSCGYLQKLVRYWSPPPWDADQSITCTRVSHYWDVVSHGCWICLYLSSFCKDVKQRHRYMPSEANHQTRNTLLPICTFMQTKQVFLLRTYVAVSISTWITLGHSLKITFTNEEDSGSEISFHYSCKAYCELMRIGKHCVMRIGKHCVANWLRLQPIMLVIHLTTNTHLWYSEKYIIAGIYFYRIFLVVSLNFFTTL